MNAGGLVQGRGPGRLVVVPPTRKAQKVKPSMNSKPKPDLSGHYESMFIMEGDATCLNSLLVELNISNT